ncbi:Uncharacterised protein [Mycobacteroides abscessus]|nr:Uncharacterised protein [Mycobacteroides abscessus]
MVTPCSSRVWGWVEDSNWSIFTQVTWQLSLTLCR